MEITINKKDVLWGYLAQFFSIASGVIVLPLILRTLSAEEIGMNYLMLTIGSLVALFDFGFSNQFGRNITYVFSGAQELKKEGIANACAETGINYRLLSTMIATAKYVYRRLALFIFIFMLTLGSLYIYKVTNGFTNVKNSFFIWSVYSTSVFFNIYYAYYSSLLVGKGMIMESKKAVVYSRIMYIILVYLFIFLKFGLLGVAAASLIAPFINRMISHSYFFTKELKNEIKKFDISKEEKLKLFQIIWHNAKKLGLVFIGSYAVTKSSLFLAGLFLSLKDVASYGLMLQLGGLIVTISSTLFTIYVPKFSSLRIMNDTEKLFKEFSYTMNIYYILFILGSFCLIIFVPYLLFLIKSKTELPAMNILMLYLFIIFLEGNHSNFATFIASENKVPFVKSSLIAGGAIVMGSFISLKFTALGILGLVLAQGICQIAYSNWKWPYVVCKEFHKNYLSFIKLGFQETFCKINQQIRKIHYGYR